uniref:Uncharacterized protein n=1 Tax=Romanomermis culicivorax TaxID=13658 RepID=A0A915JAL8_ROMCU
MTNGGDAPITISNNENTTKNTRNGGNINLCKFILFFATFRCVLPPAHRRRKLNTCTHGNPDRLADIYDMNDVITNIDPSNSVAGLLRRVTVGEKDQRLQACLEFQRVLFSVQDARYFSDQTYGGPRATVRLAIGLIKIMLNGKNCLVFISLCRISIALGREPFAMLRALDEQLYSRLSFEFKREVARCIGTLGYIMGYKTVDFFEWLSGNYDRCAGSDIKELYMAALLTTFKCDTAQRRLENLAAKILTHLKSTLETSESHDLLMPIFDVILSIACNYPNLFVPHFKDIVDILMGWYVDPDQSDKLLDQLDRTLHKLQNFWLGDLSFTFTLMSQFLEDAERDIQELKQRKIVTRKSDVCSLKNIVAKVSCLIRDVAGTGKCAMASGTGGCPGFGTGIHVDEQNINKMMLKLIYLHHNS